MKVLNAYTVIPGLCGILIQNVITIEGEGEPVEIPDNGAFFPAGTTHLDYFKTVSGTGENTVTKYRFVLNDGIKSASFDLTDVTDPSWDNDDEGFADAIEDLLTMLIVTGIPN